MSKDDPTAEAQAALLKEQMGLLAADADKVLGVLAGAEAARATKQARIAARLEKALGKDAPSVAQLRSSSVTHRDLGTTHADALKRIGRLPKLNREDCGVLGDVVDSSGKPARGLRVRLTDKARVIDIGGRTTTTDQFGEFALVYPKCNLGVVGGTTPEAFLVVEDAKKQVLFTSPKPVKTTPGRPLHFEIVLTSAVASTLVVTPKASKTAGAAKRKGSTKKRTARAGSETAHKPEENGGEAKKRAPRKTSRKPRKTKPGPSEPKE